MTIEVNIGSGPNSVAVLRVVEGSLTTEQQKALKRHLKNEDGLTLCTIARWLQETQFVTLRLAGAHHSIEIVETDEGEMDFCIFCGADYHWRVRCPGNPEGDI